MSLTPEQLAIRKQRLSATDMGAICGVNQFRTAADVQVEKLYSLEPLEETEAMKLGNMFEKPIIERAAAELGFHIQYPMPTLIHPTNPILCCTPDAGVAGIQGQLAGIEGKTAGIVRGFVETGEWGEPGSDSVPDQYKIQTLCQMAVMDWQIVHLAAVIAGRGFVLYEIPRSNEDIEGLIAIAESWWARHIIDQDPCVDADGAPIYPTLETLQRIRRVPNREREVSGELFRAWDEANEQRLAAEKIEKAAKEALLASMGDGDGLVCGEQLVATYYQQSRDSFDAKAMAQKYPEIAAEFAYDSVFRVLRRASKDAKKEFARRGRREFAA